MERPPHEEPAYAGLPTFRKLPYVPDARDLEGADVAIVGAPMDDFVTYRPGTRFGPRAIRDATDDAGAWHIELGVDPFAELKVVDHGDIPVVPMGGERNLERVREGVAGILATGAAPVVLGGDHSISYACIAAVAERHGTANVGVIHFDTHADTATHNFEMRRAHGTPFRHLVDEGLVNGDRLVQIGLRGLWPTGAEFAWAREAGVRWHSMDEVEARGIGAVAAAVIDELADAEHLYLSIDIDVLDPAYAPGTGTPEPGGLTTRELLRAVRAIVTARGFAGMDLVEVCPAYDHGNITALAADRAVVEALSALAAHERA